MQWMDDSILLPELWTSALPTAPLHTNVALSPRLDFTHQTDTPSLPNGQLTRWTRDVRRPNQTAPTTEPTESPSVHNQTQPACRRANHPGPAATIRSEDSSFGIDALCISPASGVSTQPISDESTCRGQLCGTPIFDGRQTPPTHCTSLTGPCVLHPSCESPHIPTDAEKARARARISEREVRIDALEVRIKDLKAAFETESQEKYAAIKHHFDSRILTIQKEITDRLNDVLGRTPGGGNGGHGGEGEECALPCPEVRTLGIRYSS